jgi:trehalose/maltose hydrolase-like predicted phosphorylase
MSLLQKLGFFALLILVQLKIYPQDSSYIFKTESFNNYTPASLGNGYFSIETSQLGSKPASSYMVWVYDKGNGDVSRIARLPAWNEIDYYDGTNYLNKTELNPAKFPSYVQTLNMFNGVLNTKYKWNDNGKITTVETETFISRKRRNLAVIKFEITPFFTGDVKIKFSLKTWEPPKRKRYAELKKISPNPPGSYPAEWYPGYMKLLDKGADTSNKIILWMTSKAEGRPVYAAEVTDISCSPELKNKIKFINEKNESSAEVYFHAQANHSYTFYKYISIVSSHETDDFLRSAKKICAEGASDEYFKLSKENDETWSDLWKTDIIIEGNPELQKIVHSMMYYLFCSIRAGTGFSIPPMGLANDGYYGHIFWDADTFMFPSLLLMHPDMAKSVVNFRFRALDPAKANAKKNGFKGAMYPWESDEIGNEATPAFAYQNALKENHITGDVAFAQWQYYLATQNKKWLADTGYNVIKAAADFWISRSSFNKEKNRYEIKNVVSVDEGRVGIDNDTYTNSIAKKNLEIAISASNILHAPVNPKWEEVKNKIYIPYDSVNHIFPTYENAPDSILGSVVTLLSYPLEVKMDDSAKINNLKNAANLVFKEGPGAMMTITLLPVIAAEVKNKKLLNRLFELSYKGYLHPPFNVLTETPHNHSINFITGAGGFLQQVIYGYTGLRITDEGIIQKYKSMLPNGIKELTLKNFYINRIRYDINVRNNNLTMTKSK